MPIRRSMFGRDGMQHGLGIDATVFARNLNADVLQVRQAGLSSFKTPLVVSASAPCTINQMRLCLFQTMLR